MEILPSDMARYKAIIASLGLSEAQAFEKITQTCQLMKSLYDLTAAEDATSQALRAQAKDSFRRAAQYDKLALTRTTKLDDLSNEGASNTKNLNEVTNDAGCHSQSADLL